MTTKPTYEELAETVRMFDKTLKSLYNSLGRNPKSEAGKEVDLLNLLQPLWSVDGIVAALNDLESKTPSALPEQDELAAGLVYLDDAWAELFAQTCSNPITNAWGKQVDFSGVNNFREKASGIVWRTRLALKGETPQAKPEVPEASNIQKYLENFDEYSFTDLLLRDMISSEQRRQSKNCPEVQSREEIGKTIREDLNGCYSPIELAVMIVQALSYAAKGETK